MGRRLTTRFLSSWSRREGMVRACLGQTYNKTHKCQILQTWSRDDPRNTKQRLNASITLCMRLSVYCTDKQTFHATEWHSFVVLVFKSVCASHHFAAEKKLLINFKTSFSRIVVGKKVANQNWKSKLLPEKHNQNMMTNFGLCMLATTNYWLQIGYNYEITITRWS